MMKQSFMFGYYCVALVLCTLNTLQTFLLLSTSLPSTYSLTFLFKTKVISLQTSKLITMSGSGRSRKHRLQQSSSGNKRNEGIDILSFPTQSSHKTIQVTTQVKMKPLLNRVGILRLHKYQPVLLCRRPYAVTANVRLPGKIQKLIRS